MILDYEKAKDAILRVMSGKVSTVTATRVILALKEATIEAAPVVHGEWSTIEDDYAGLIALQCSECNQEYWFEDDPPLKIYNYCPNCGARMVGDGNA